jgi:hypothetical protein
MADPDARPILKGKLRADRVRLRLPALRTDREHAPRRARTDPDCDSEPVDLQLTGERWCRE